MPLTDAPAATSSPSAAHREQPGPPGLAWPNALHALGPAFFTELPPQPLPQPHWVAASPECAALLGLPADWQHDAALQSLDVFSGAALWKGMQPLATVYSGHQFGVWAGQLGDGRALWLGEADTPSGPLEVQLKGSGRTPYSRFADGRAVLRSSIREFLCSEAMAALGIATTRALCIVGSPLPVRRETVETAAVVTRVAPSFLRFGHFEHFAHTAPGQGDEAHAALARLAGFVIEHHYPELSGEPEPVLALLRSVARRTGELMAAWQSVGFCHGVMNTDNMSILGLTIDYGPFGFLDAFDPNHICNHSDSEGRYAYGRQPSVGYWNLLALAQALLPLIGDTEAAIAAAEEYKGAFVQALQQKMRAKLGLADPREEDQQLVEDLLALMAKDRADFTITFRKLAEFSTAEGERNEAVRDLFIDREAFDAWGRRYAARLAAEQSVDAGRALTMKRANPRFVLRNHLAESAIRQAGQGDFSEVERLQRILAAPFEEQPEHEAYAGFPPAWAQTIEVSCSS